MQITLDINQPSDLQILLPLFKRMGIGVQQNLEKLTPIGEENTNSDLIYQETGTIEAVQRKKNTWDFSYFYGSANRRLSLEEIDNQFKQLREEWDRNIF